ncbi:MAG: thioredoxin [Burkholderiales bacterium]
MATVTLTKDNFEQIVTENNFVVVDFWAPWCAPCRGFAPVFEAASEQHQDIVFGKINTEEEEDLGGMFNIRSIPTLMIFREKVIIFSQPGALPGKQFEELIGKARELDMGQVQKEIAEQKTTAPTPSS